MRHKVIFSPEARDDLFGLYAFIAQNASPRIAFEYVERLERYCVGFADFPERGTRRDELRPSLRTVGFEGRATIAFHIAVDVVVIDRVLYGGRDLEAAIYGET